MNYSCLLAAFGDSLRTEHSRLNSGNSHSEPESDLNPIAVSHDTRLGVSRDVHRNVVADAVVAVAPEPDRSTAAHHATAVSTGPTTNRTHDRDWTLSATPSTPTPSNAGKPTAQHISNRTLPGAKPRTSRRTSNLRRLRLLGEVPADVVDTGQKGRSPQALRYDWIEPHCPQCVYGIDM